MATKIIPDSFRTLSLDLTEPVDYNFFDDSQAGSGNNTEQPEVEKQTDTVKQANFNPKTNTNSPNEAIQMETKNTTEVKSITDSKPSLSPTSLENHKLPHQPNSKPKSDSPTRSILSVSYESDFTNQDTQTKDVLNDDHQSCTTQQAEERVDKKENSPLHPPRSRSHSSSSSATACDESDITDVSRVLPYPQNKTLTAYRAEAKEDRSRAADMQTDPVAEIDMEKFQTRHLNKVMSRIDRQLKAMRIRPPWRDPNSRPLPSDRAVSFYDLYDEFERNNRPLSGSVRCLSQNEIAVCRPYHTTLNRYRQQERIQMENYALAKRLQNIRPSPGMTRTEQLREYKRYFIPSTCFTARPPPIIYRPMSCSYSVDHAGDHDSKSTGNTKTKRSSRRSWSAKPHAKRNTRSAGSRSLASNTEAPSLYEFSANKTCRSVSKDRIRGPRRGPSGSTSLDMRCTNWSNATTHQTNSRQNSATRSSGSINKTHPARYDSSSPTETNQLATEEVSVLPTPPPPSPRGSEVDMNHTIN